MEAICKPNITSPSAAGILVLAAKKNKINKHDSLNNNESLENFSINEDELDADHSGDFAILSRKVKGQGNIKMRTEETPKKIIQGQKEVSMSQWCITAMKEDRAIGVEGHRSGDPEDDFWASSLIIKRIDAKTVETGSGTVYRLKGTIEKEFTYHQGFSKEFVLAFNKGFPNNWRELVQKHYDQLSEANEKSKVQFTDIKVSDAQTGNEENSKPQKVLIQETSERAVPKANERKRRSRYSRNAKRNTGNKPAEEQVGVRRSGRIKQKVQDSTPDKSDEEQNVKTRKSKRLSLKLENATHDKSGDEVTPKHSGPTRRKTPKSGHDANYKHHTRTSHTRHTVSKCSKDESNRECTSESIVEDDLCRSTVGKRRRVTRKQIQNDRTTQDTTSHEPERKPQRKDGKRKSVSENENEELPRRVKQKTKENEESVPKNNQPEKGRRRTRSKQNKDVIANGGICNGSKRSVKKQQNTNKKTQDVKESSANTSSSELEENNSSKTKETEKKTTNPAKAKKEPILKVTAGKGTLKRKKQIREILQQQNEGHEDNFFALQVPMHHFIQELELDSIGEENEFGVADSLKNYRTPTATRQRLAVTPFSARKTPANDYNSPAIPARNVDRDKADKLFHRIMKNKTRGRAQKMNKGAKKNHPTTPFRVLRRSPVVTSQCRAAFQESQKDESDSEGEKDYYWSDVE